MLTDNELILLGLESEMERIAKDFKIVLDHVSVDDDNDFKKLVAYREQYKLLEARHDSLTEIEF